MKTFIYKNLRECRRHFAAAFLTRIAFLYEGKNRLCKLAIPMLFIQGPDRNREQPRGLSAHQFLVDYLSSYGSPRDYVTSTKSCCSKKRGTRQVSACISSKSEQPISQEILALLCKNHDERLENL